MFTDKYLSMCKYYIIIFLLFLSCKEKISFREISLHDNIIEKIKNETNFSKQSGVYIVSLFTDEGKNVCEIVKYKEVLPASNFKGCQIIDRDTIFLFTDNSFSNCYKLLNRKIYFNKREPIPGNKKEIGYYEIDTLNCKMTKFTPIITNKIH
ncbi:hypothetical protein [Chryseobacterium daecheongense]|uniref:Uncharacterized protein n=1 Tax=Chryseobacterium daecheongense TaxID=192389 RepID=A0A3N0VZB8_9FLAO|nr:hypothetical protein [Chryseobacterium daecheongense]ROH98152.1 hypothetical protein EGI05_12510 [Chryseobacterium daecheongense]TDX92644.1 hypothetical protein BCF50_1583 [Chryseobacterium daecheongense]